jgi:hypothetical protein
MLSTGSYTDTKLDAGRIVWYDEEIHVKRWRSLYNPKITDWSSKDECFGHTSNTYIGGVQTGFRALCVPKVGFRGMH